MAEVHNYKDMLAPSLQHLHISEETIRNTYPRDPNIDTVAHVLVSERHGKFDLVHLVAYLLHKSMDK